MWNHSILRFYKGPMYCTFLMSTHARRSEEFVQRTKHRPVDRLNSDAAANNPFTLPFNTARISYSLRRCWMLAFRSSWTWKLLRQKSLFQSPLDPVVLPIGQRASLYKCFLFLASNAPLLLVVKSIIPFSRTLTEYSVFERIGILYNNNNYKRRRSVGSCCF